MKKLLIAIGLVMSATWAHAAPSEAQAQEQANKAAQEWLTQVDAGNYAATWEQGTTLLQAAVSKEKWEQSIVAVRKPLGQLKQRQLLGAKVLDNPAGAPPGMYVLLQYGSQWANKPDAVETVTPMLDKDGVWKVSGYFIK